MRRRWKSYRKRLEWCAAHGGLIKWGANFRYREFASKGNGWIRIARPLYLACERVRKRAGAFGILSAYRDPAHNARVGGASSSIHLYGGAVDPSRWLRQSDVAGIVPAYGTDRSISGPVRHFDVRGLGGVPNFTHGSIGRPTRWVYG